MEAPFYLLTMPTLLSGILVAGSGLFVLVHEGTNRISVSLAAVCLLMAGWILGKAGVYVSVNEENALFFSNIASLSVILSTPVIYQFATTVMNIGNRRRYYFIAGLWLVSLTFFFLQLTQGLLLNQLYEYSFGYYLKYSAWGIVHLSYHSLVLILCMTEYIRVLMHYQYKDRFYYRIYGLLISFLIGALGLWDALPILGVDVLPLGHIPILVSIIIMVTVIVKYRLMDISPGIVAREIIETMADPLVVCDANDRIRVANSSAKRAFFNQDNHVSDATITQIFDAKQLVKFRQYRQQSSFKGQIFYLQVADGRNEAHSLSLSYIFDNKTGNALGYVLVAHNIQRYQTIQERLRVMASLPQYNTNPMFQISADDKIVYANDAAKVYLRNWQGQLPQKLVRLIHLAFSRDNPVQDEILYGTYTMLVTASHVYDLNRVNLYFTDITDQKKWEHYFEEMARIDPVTDYLNRHGFEQCLDNELSKLERYDQGQALALIMVDLDNFKQVNDTLGHPVGDKLLRESADRINSALRKGDILARIGGDEFIALIHPVKHEENAGTVGHRILSSFKTPFDIDNHEINQSVSIGVATYPKAGQTSTALMKNVDRALFSAKAKGKSTLAIYSARIAQIYNTRVHKQAVMTKALREGGLQLAFEPQYDLTTNKLRGLEVLIKSNDPSIGTIYPTQVSQYAESRVLYEQISYWVVHNLSRLHTLYNKSGQSHALSYLLSFKITAQYLVSDLFNEHLQLLIQNGSVNPENIELIVAEGASGRMHDKLGERLETCRQYGFVTGMNGFGSAYCPPGQLSDSKLNTLKIDADDTKQLLQNRHKQIIIESLIEMGQTLGFDIVVEGVENKQMFEVLVNYKDLYGQGSYLSNRITYEQLAGFINSLNQKDG